MSSERNDAVQADAVNIFVLASTVLVGVVFGFYVREKATKAGHEDQASWSPTGDCVVKTYVRNFSGLGMAGRIFGLFSSDYYYRVYSKGGELLKTSEWNLFESEAGEADYARWVYGNVLYPTTKGYGRWALRGCNG